MIQIDLAVGRLEQFVNPQLALVISECPAAQEAENWTLSPEAGLQKPGGERFLLGEHPVGTWLRCGENAPVFITRANQRAGLDPAPGECLKTRACEKQEPARDENG